MENSITFNVFFIETFPKQLRFAVAAGQIENKLYHTLDGFLIPRRGWLTISYR